MFMSSVALTFAFASAQTCSLEQANEMISNQTSERALALCDELAASSKRVRTPKGDADFRQFLRFCRRKPRSLGFLCGRDNGDVLRWRKMAGLEVPSSLAKEPAKERSAVTSVGIPPQQNADSGQRGAPLAADQALDSSPSTERRRSMTGLDPTGTGLVGAAAQGIADFLVNQAEKELQLFVVNRIRDRVCDNDRNAELRKILINTCTFFGSKSGYFSPSFGPGFVAAVQADIEGVPRRLADAANDPPSESGLALVLHLELLDVIRATQDPLQIVSALSLRASEYSCDGGTKRCVAAQEGIRKTLLILKAAMISTSPRRRSDGALSGEHLQDVARLLLGRSRLNAKQKADLQRVLWSARNVWDSHRRLRSRPMDSRRLLLESSELLRLFISSVNAISPDLIRHVEMRTDVVGIARAFAERDYGGVLTRSIGLTEALLGARIIPDDAAKVLAFGSDLARARTPEQAQAALENFSAPIGSWRGKREGFGLYLNGLVGAGAGFELLVGTEISEDKAVPIAPAFVASVGLDVNFAVDDNFTVGAYLSLIDLGALAAIRYDNVHLAKDPDLQVADVEVSSAGVDDLLAILAPGAFFGSGSAKRLSYLLRG